MAGCTGTSPTVCTGAVPCPTSSWAETQNWLRLRILPWSSTWVPSPIWVATHGWLNHTATAGPVSSNTRASTRLRRRSRIGLTDTERTVTATVASSPTPTLEIVRASRRSWWVWGRCSSRSPCVSMPSAARPFAVRPRAFTGSASRLGRGIERTAASGGRSSFDAKTVAIGSVCEGAPTKDWPKPPIGGTLEP